MPTWHLHFLRTNRTARLGVDHIRRSRDLVNEALSIGVAFLWIQPDMSGNGNATVFPRGRRLVECRTGFRASNMRKVKTQTQTRQKSGSMAIILWKSCPKPLHMRYLTLRCIQLTRRKHLHHYIYSNIQARVNPESEKGAQKGRLALCINHSQIHLTAAATYHKNPVHGQGPRQSLSRSNFFGD